MTLLKKILNIRKKIYKTNRFNGSVKAINIFLTKKILLKF